MPSFVLARRSRWLVLLLILGAVALLVMGCATTGSTLGSGVGDRELQRPPYYAGQRVVPQQLRIGHYPVAYQAAGISGFDPAANPGTPLASLLAEMNAFLDSLGVTTRLAAEGTHDGTPPDVRFGCDEDAAGDCIPPDPAVFERGAQSMRLAVGRPSAEWIAWNAANTEQANVDASLVLTVELGQYWIRQRRLRGDKEVDLGTGHTVSFPWLTSLETPVSVIQLTGALVRRDGTAHRIGTEGLAARRTRLLVSAIRAQELVRSEDVDRLRTARRNDLPGQPLVWQAALREMLAELTGQEELRPR